MSPLLTARPSVSVTLRLLGACLVMVVVAGFVPLAGGDGESSAAVPACLTLAIVCAALVGHMLYASAQATDDPRMAWLSAGTTVAFIALICSLLALPSLFPHGGPVNQSANSAAARYLIWHAALLASALLALSGRKPTLKALFIFGGLGALLLAWAAVAPSPLGHLASGTGYSPVMRALTALIVVAQGGADGLTLKPLTPGASPNGFDGLTTGFVFAALSFVGFEAAATLGDEVRSPRRIVPRAVLLSVLAVGGLYVFCVWAEVIGLGADTTNRLDGSATPWNDLAQTYAAWMKWPVIVASVSSMFAVMINSSNGIVRILNTMGREGLLPRMLAYIDPRRQTPSRAVFVTGVFTVALALVVGAVSGGLGNPSGGSNVYGYLGFLLTLGILPVYVLVNLAAARYFLAAGRFRLIRHGVLPIGGAALMVALLVGQIVEQTTKPYTWFPWVIVIWVALVGLGALWLASARPREFARAGAVLAEPDPMVMV
jgi:amino acid transporter